MTSKPTETELLPERVKCEKCGTEVSRYDSLRGYCMICAGDAVDAARTPSPTPSSAEVRARARELVDEWRNTWRGMSDACMTANRIDLIDRIARLSTPQPTLQQVDNRAAIDLLEKWLSETPSEDEESWEKIRRLIDENRLSDRKFWPELSTTQPTLQQAIECVKGLRDEWAGNEEWVDAADEIITALSSLASTKCDKEQQ